MGAALEPGNGYRLEGFELRAWYLVLKATGGVWQGVSGKKRAVEREHPLPPRALVGMWLLRAIWTGRGACSWKQCGRLVIKWQEKVGSDIGYLAGGGGL